MERNGKYYDAPDYVGGYTGQQELDWVMKQKFTAEATEVRCRHCGNTGIDFMGQPCTCSVGRQVALSAQRPEAMHESPPSLEMEQQVAKIQAIARGKKTRKEVAAKKNLSVDQQQRLTAAQGRSEDRRTFLKDVHERLGVSKEVYNSSKELQQAHLYLEKHRIPNLLDTLLAQAILDRPEDLRAHLVKLLADMKASRGHASTGPFTKEDIETMFDMWDELKTGVIPATKLIEQLKALQLGPRAELAVFEEYGANSMVDCGHEEVNKATFVTIVTSELQKHFSSNSFYG